LIEQLAQNRRKVAWLLLGVAILFTGLALTVIHNTIRLALYADRFLIKTQELVGASWEFISRPYLHKALWHGLLSALLAIGLLVGLQYAIRQQVPEVAAFQTPALLGSVCLVLLIVGLSISWLSTYRVVRKYLRLREDELY
jgi:cell division transport system permease protein